MGELASPSLTAGHGGHADRIATTVSNTSAEFTDQIASQGDDPWPTLPELPPDVIWPG